MIIQVELIDGCTIGVVPRGLDLLLKRHLVRRFLRSSGWVVIGRDPIREASRESLFPGPERRRHAF